MADIRKWFKKPAEATTSQKNEDAGNGTPKVSKYFADSQPKVSPSKGKRSIEDGAEPSPKKSRGSGASDTPRGGGRGRGAGKAETKKAAVAAAAAAGKADDTEKETSPVKAEDALEKSTVGRGAGKPAAAGRGGGKGRGKSDDAGKSAAKDDAPSSPAGGRGAGKPAAAGRGAGKGRGKSDDAGKSAAKDDAPSTPAGGRGAGKPAGGRGRGRGAFFNGQRDAPPHKGEKEVPEGADNALAGLTFVISGTLDSLEREEMEDLLKRHGGRVTSAVSKKTSFLVADEDIGGRKSEKAHELGIPFLTEDDVFEKIRASKPEEKKQETKTSPVKQSPAKKEVKPSEVSSSIVRDEKVVSSDTEIEIWPQKHRPKSTDEIIGNQSIVKQLKDWIQHWDENNLHPAAKGKGKKGSSGGASNAKKAAILSGPPGIGKTTTARLLCEELGYEAMEVNASDSRGKANPKVQKGIGGSTANTVKEMVSNSALGFNGAKTRHKSVLIMDEVDGMSAGDRGGVADLIASIKISKIPIICICNDRYSQKLKSLMNYCLQLNYRKPTKQQMAKRLQQITRSEGVNVDELALEELADRTHGDMRLALNQLQYMSLHSKVLKYADIKAYSMASGKDEDITPFNAVDKLMGFDGGRVKMDDRLDLAMSDFDLVPLIIQENYINYRPGGAGRDESARMDRLAEAAACIADGDIVNVQIRRYRQWQHSQMGAFMSSIIPAALMHGQREVLTQGERNFNRFGGWLGKNSTFGKKKRLLEDVHVHLLASRVCEPSREAVRMDYLPVLVKRLTLPLRTLEKNEAVRAVLDVMEEYSLTQEDFETIIDITKLQGVSDPLEGVAPAVKSALTKAYTQRLQERPIRCADILPPLPGQKKKAPKKKPRGMVIEENEEEGVLEEVTDDLIPDDEEKGGEEEEEESSEEEEKADMEKLKRSNAGYEISIVGVESKAGSSSAKKGPQKKRAATKPSTPASKRKK